jgi:DNA-binding response OmpR family regulator
MEEMMGCCWPTNATIRSLMLTAGWKGWPRRAASSELIILDLMMPDLPGYEVFRRLHANPVLRKVPVLLLTVIPPQMVYPKAQQLGIAGYICKPFEFETLLTARDALLRGETFYPSLPGQARRST